MKTFLVPFQEQETVWVQYEAKVEAGCENDAFYIIKQMVEQNDSPHKVYDCINANVAEHIESDGKFFMDSFTINDVKLIDERICCEVSFVTLDFFNKGITKDTIIQKATESFKRIGLTLEIEEFELKPIRIEEQFVYYDFIPTTYKNIFADGEIVHFEDGKKIKSELSKCSLEQLNQKLQPYGLMANINTFDGKYVGYIAPLGNENTFIFGSSVCIVEILALEYLKSRTEYILEYGLNYPTSIEQLEVLPETKERVCHYDRTTCIVLPMCIDLKELEKRLLDVKSSVVKFQNKTYIVARKDGDWVLWECEI